MSLATLDLSNLESMQEFATQFSNSQSQLNLLINKTGVMVPPETKTQQGYELQFGVNHLGHFALTGHLSGLIMRTPNARVATVSSVAHRTGKIDFDDLNFEKSEYAPWLAYSQSKLANLLFTLELQHRFTTNHVDAIAVSSHPGYTATDLQRTTFLFRALLNPLLAMKPAQGALPTLRASTDPFLKGGEYFGPHRFKEMNGYPVLVTRTDAAKNKVGAKRLWQISEDLTGVKYEINGSLA